jgi:hypothetical protein
MRIRLTAAAATASTCAIGGFVMGAVGVAIGSSQGGPHTSVVLRGVLPLALVLLSVRVITSWALRSGESQPLAAVLAGALVGYVVDPFSWGARAGLTQLAVGAGIASYLADLVIWLVAATLGVLWSAAETPVRDRPPTPYG